MGDGNEDEEQCEGKAGNRGGTGEEEEAEVDEEREQLWLAAAFDRDGEGREEDREDDEGDGGHGGLLGVQGHAGAGDGTCMAPGSSNRRRAHGTL